MKLLPILVVTNAATLVFCAILFFQQQDLADRTGTTRTQTQRGEVIDADDLNTRLASLEQALANARVNAPAAAIVSSEAVDEETPSVPGGEPMASNEGGEPEGAEFEPGEMEVFRKKVRKAEELNRDQDWMDRVEGRLDRLVTATKISPLTKTQKRKLATKMLAIRNEAPNIWVRLRESGALENASREERGEMIRAEYDSLRTEAQQSLSDVVPAADAKTIIDESGRDLMRGGFDRGGMTRQRGTGGTTNRGGR